MVGFLLIKSLAMTYFHMANATLSSARSSFTSEFGMGSGGSHSLWSPGNSGRVVPFNRQRLITWDTSLDQLNQHTGLTFNAQTAWVLYSQASRAISIR